MTDYALRLSGTQKRFGDFHLDIPSLELRKGYILGLVGQNGAGKSTLLKMIMNLIYPEQGTIEVLGLSQPQQEIEIKRQIGYVSENPIFYEDATVEWMAKLTASCYPTWSDSAYRSYLKQFGLVPTKRTKELSKGMKVRLALLLALAHSPELLILDEPTSGIDPVERREILEEISNVITDERRTVIFSSHISQDVEQIADYVAIVHDGRIADFDDKESLLDRWRQVSGRTEQGAPIMRSLFTTYLESGHDFIGTTNRFSPALLSELERSGATMLKSTRLSIDAILMSVAGKEPGRCGF